MAKTKYTVKVYFGNYTETHEIFADHVSFGPNYLKFLNGPVTDIQELVASFPAGSSAIINVKKDQDPWKEIG